jgi:hypothetical protein
VLHRAQPAHNGIASKQGTFLPVDFKMQMIVNDAQRYPRCAKKHYTTCCTHHRLAGNKSQPAAPTCTQLNFLRLASLGQFSGVAYRAGYSILYLQGYGTGGAATGKWAGGEGEWRRWCRGGGGGRQPCGS